MWTHRHLVIPTYFFNVTKPPKNSDTDVKNYYKIECTNNGLILVAAADANTQKLWVIYFLFF